MALKGFPFTSIGHDRRYGASDWVQYFSHFVGNGVFAGKASEMQVVAGNNMTINVLSGSGWIDGVIAVNSGSFPITLGNASGVATRIDRIVLRLNMTDRTMELLSIQGITEAAPALVRDGTFYDLGLANIYVAAGTTAITQAMITDTRFDSSVCGIVKGLIEEINPTNLFAQYDAEFQAFKGRMSADDIAASLQMQINNVNTRIADKLVVSNILFKGSSTQGICLPVNTFDDYSFISIDFNVDSRQICNMKIFKDDISTSESDWQNNGITFWAGAYSVTFKIASGQLYIYSSLSNKYMLKIVGYKVAVKGATT